MATLFISCVSDEFANYRDAIRKDFTRPNLETKIQEDFIAPAVVGIRANIPIEKTFPSITSTVY